MLGAAGGHYLRSRRDPGQYQAQHVVTAWGQQLMKVVHHEYEPGRARGEGSSQPRCGSSQHLGAQSLDFGHEVGPARVDLHVRRGQHGDQAGGVVIETVERYPGDAAFLCTGPLGQEGRLAVTSRRRDPDHPATARTSGLDELAAANAARAQLGRRQLELEQRLAEVAGFWGCLRQPRDHGRVSMRR